MKSKMTRFLALLLSVLFVFGLLTINPSKAEEPTNNKETVDNGTEPVVLMDGLSPEKYYEREAYNALMANAPSPANNLSTSFRAVGTSGMAKNNFGVAAPPITIDGRVAYCLNAQKDYPVAKNYSTSSPYSDLHIRAALYHGYPVDGSGLQKKYGVSDDDARYYTQIAMWTYTNPGFMADKRGRVAYYDELLAKVQAGDVAIKKFSLSESNLNFTIQDDGSYLSQQVNTSGASGTYNVTTSDNRAQVLNANNGQAITSAPIGTPFKVKLPADFDGNINLDFTTDLKQPAGLKWNAPANNLQDLVEFKWGDPLTGANRATGLVEGRGSIEVVKTDAVTNGALQGAKFEVRKQADDSLLGTIVTGEDGRGRLDNLPLVEYVIKEVEAPENYWVDSTPHKITLTSNNRNAIHSASNRPKRAQIKIIKKDKESGATLSGATFSVKNTQTNVVHNLVTEANGTIVSPWLTPGTYEVRETAPPAGYILDSNPVRTVEVTGNPELLEVEFNNQRIRGKLKVIKTDGESVKLLAGAVFGIFREGTEDKVAEITTDNNGEAVTDWLDYGNYDVKELQAPNGYYTSNQTWKLNVAEHEKVYLLEIGNKPAKAKIRVIKTDGETVMPIAGVTFKIQDENGKDIVFKEVAEDNTINDVTEFTTDKKGEFTTPDYLYKGNYKLVEVKHHPKYLDIEPIDFTISENEIYPELEVGPVKTLEVKNVKLRGNLKLIKLFQPTAIDNKLHPNTTPQSLFDMRDGLIPVPVDPRKPVEPTREETPDKDIIKPGDSEDVIKPTPEDLSNRTEAYPLKEAKFELYRLNSDKLLSELTDKEKENAEWELVGTYETDEDGEISYAGLVWGSYKLEEIELPHDFKVIEATHFDITENEQSVETTIINEAVPGEVEITKFDVHDGELLPGAHFQILDEDKNVILEGVTDDKGLFKFKLGIGKYYYKETQAPSLNGTQYILDENEYPFEIKEKGEVVKCKAPNKKRDIPKTNAGVGSLGIPAAVGGMLGAVYVLRKRRKK